MLSRCCFPSQDTELAFINIKTTRLVCCEHRGHRNGQINKRIANTLEYSILLLHSMQLLLSEEEDSSDYVYMGDPKQIRHFPMPQGIFRRMASKNWISCSLSIAHLLQYFRIPNLPLQRSTPVPSYEMSKECSTQRRRQKRPKL